MPAEVRQIQRALGGPAVDQYRELRPAAQPADAGQTDRRPALADRRTRSQVGALREAAAQLDVSANRLESLELYSQADAMRGLAQRLRTGARKMGPDPQGAVERPALQAPTLWSQPVAPPASAPATAAQPAPPLQPTPANPN